MERKRTEDNVVIKSQTSAAISGHQTRGEQLLVMDHAPDQSRDLPSSQTPDCDLCVFPGIPEILKKSDFALSLLFLATSKACSKNAFKSNRFIVVCHHQMQFLLYSANPCQHHHLPASSTVSAQFGKLALTAVTPSIPKDNQPSRDPFLYFIQIHKPIARTLQKQ